MLYGNKMTVYGGKSWDVHKSPLKVPRTHILICLAYLLPNLEISRFESKSNHKIYRLYANNFLNDPKWFLTNFPFISSA